MTITPLDAAQNTPVATVIEPDAPRASQAGGTGMATFGFGSLIDALQAGTQTLQRAEGAENAFIAGTGGLQEMVFERAKADVLVSIATAASSRVTQSINSITQMQL
jgi:flagellar hook-basal body complex protein FliE